MPEPRNLRRRSQRHGVFVRPAHRGRQRELTPEHVGARQVQRAVIPGASAIRLGPRAGGVPAANLDAQIPPGARPAPEVVPLEVLQPPLVEPRHQRERVDPPGLDAAHHRARGCRPDDPGLRADAARVRHHGHDIRAGDGREHLGLLRLGPAEERHVVQLGPERHGRDPSGGQVRAIRRLARVERAPVGEGAAGVVRQADGEPVALRQLGLGRARVVEAGAGDALEARREREHADDEGRCCPHIFAG